MSRCIQIATYSEGAHKPNPEVGSVIVYQDKLIGEGWHKKFGEAHAEVHAIDSVQDKSLLSESTLFVTLEPCFHFGKTPPCLDLILMHKIPEVVIGCQDPYAKVAGKSIQKLIAAGVKVKVGVLEKEIHRLNKRFFTNVTLDRPFILLKYAMSKDGFIADDKGKVQISTPIMQRIMHNWRGRETGILVGTETVLVDNPQLNNRFGRGTQPVRIFLDQKGKISQEAHVMDGKQLSFWITQSDENRSGVEKIVLNFQSEYFLEDLLKTLWERKIDSIMVEGGAKTLSGFLEKNLWDEAYVLRNHNLILNQGKEVAIPHIKYLEGIENYEMEEILYLKKYAFNFAQY